MLRCRDADQLARLKKPGLPVCLLRPHHATRAAEFFSTHFPGGVHYALKANPHPRIIKALMQGGVRAFDAASLHEIRLIRRLAPKARILYTHPIKPMRDIREAYRRYGVRCFVLDSAEELEKITRACSAPASSLTLLLRLRMDHPSCMHDLSGKFGASPAAAETLLPQIRRCAHRLGLCFHPGSQCLDPNAYRAALEHIGALVRRCRIAPDIINVGGGFPVAYANTAPPPLSEYVRMIKQAFAALPLSSHAVLWCEPGRALAAEAGSYLLRVEAARANALYLNDGAYGALFDMAHGRIVFPMKAIRSPAPNRPKTGFPEKLLPFRLYGPTCDSFDCVDGPFYLPHDMRAGDYIEFWQLGAYGQALRCDFNGFGTEITAIADDSYPFSAFKKPQDPAGGTEGFWISPPPRQIEQHATMMENYA